jgi:hypothetical protein
VYHAIGANKGLSHIGIFTVPADRAAFPINFTLENSNISGSGTNTAVGFGIGHITFDGLKEVVTSQHYLSTQASYSAVEGYTVPPLSSYRFSYIGGSTAGTSAFHFVPWAIGKIIP